MKAAERKLTDLEHAAYRDHSMAAVTRLILDDLLDFSTVEADRDGHRSLPCVAPRLSIHQTQFGPAHRASLCQGVRGRTQRGC
jgi:hypothetical protein